MIAFLHTSEIHIPKFQKLVEKYQPNLAVEHYVNAEILKTALSEGKADSITFQKEVKKIQAKNPDLIVCTCSTYGEECDKLESIERIDFPVAKHLAQNYKKIGVAYTATSTKVSSVNLLNTAAKEINVNIEIIDCDCSDNWVHYENNDFESYAKGIANTIKSFENKVDVVFLAQASMEGAIDHLADFKVEIFSSPEFGVKEYLKMI